MRMLETFIAIRTFEGDSGVSELRTIGQGWQGWSGRRSETLPIDDVMVGRNREESFIKSPALFVISTIVHVPVAEQIVVVYPSFLVDDRVVEAREIRFRLKRHTQVLMPINC